MSGRIKKDGFFSNLNIKGMEVLNESRNLKNVRNASINRTLTVGTTTTLKGRVNVGKNLNVDGDLDLNGSLNVGDDAIVSGNAIVNGDQIISGNSTIEGDLEVSGNIIGGNVNSVVDQKLSGEKVLIGIASVGYGKNLILSDWEEASPDSYTNTSTFIGPFETPVGGTIEVNQEDITAYIELEMTQYQQNSGSLSFKFEGDNGTDLWNAVWDLGLDQIRFKTTGASPFTLRPKFRAGSNGWDGSATMQGTVYLFKNL
jgi:cytoskeletal protein CcmA (bactofilin family)